jgi:valyl-tRNA synthetase
VLWDENADPQLQLGTRRTLVRVLESILRLSHPIMPFITEEIWHSIAPLAGIELNAQCDSIMLQTYPVPDQNLVDQASLDDIEWVKQVIVGVRNVRGEMNISPATSLSIFFTGGSDNDQRRLEENRQYLCKLAKLESITWLDNPEDAPLSATALAGDLEILVPMAGLIDIDAELKRLSKEIEKLSVEAKKLSGKLGNEKFVANAPSEVVAKERVKLNDMQGSIEQLTAKQTAIAEMA